jgi:hypothetical protein
MPLEPRWRTLAGMALILLLIAGWSVLVVAGAGWIGALPWPAQALYYLVAGIAWVLPLRPLIRWMNRRA